MSPRSPSRSPMVLMAQSKARVTYISSTRDVLWIRSVPVDREGVGMTFSGELWDRGGASVYDEIIRHPFITGLTDGTLDHDAFRYFIVQDSHYLRAYSRALALVAARAVDDDSVSMFARHAAEAIAVERELHTELLGSLGLTSADVDAAGPGPASTAYTSYLTAVCATGTYAEAVA